MTTQYFTNLLSTLPGFRTIAGSLVRRQRSWEKVEYFDDSWKKRIQEMAAFIMPGESVVDLGCGRMWLKPLLKGNTYYPVDYKARDEDTVVCDFNLHQYPDIEADVAFLSGTLEYIEDCEWFVREVCNHSRRSIISYCTTECFPELSVRRYKAWKSHLSRQALLDLFRRSGMRLEHENTAVVQNPIFVFSREQASLTK